MVRLAVVEVALLLELALLWVLWAEPSGLLERVRQELELVLQVLRPFVLVAYWQENQVVAVVAQVHQLLAKGRAQLLAIG